MAGRGNLLMKCGIAAGVLVGGALVQGVEIEQQLFASPRWGGMAFAGQPIQVTDHSQSQDGFVVAAGGLAIDETPVGKAMELMASGDWVKAIQAIESLSEAEEGLVLDDSGVLRPLSAMKSVLIASMPEQGKRTFRKLNDPSANTKLQQALGMTDLQQQASAFEAIVNDYMLCDASGQAAHRLGDIRFEQGRFDEAAGYYQFAAEHPSSAVDDPALMARRLAALARAQQWKAFDTLAQYARFRYPETTITIGGQATPIQQFITQLVASRGDEPVDVPTRGADKLVLPDTDRLEFDRPLIDPDQLESLRMFATNNNLGGVIDQLIAPVVASDEQSLFTLALGVVARLDPETGSELWRVGESDELVMRLQSRMHYLTRGYSQALVVHGDTLLAVIPDSQQSHISHLVALDAQTGEQRWSLREYAKRNSNESVVGRPIVVDDLIYYVTYRSNEELMLNSVSLAFGTPGKTLSLGKASKGSNMQAPAELSPRLTMGHSHLLVQTNNGALIAVEPGDMTIAWALSQKIRPSGLNMMQRHGQPVIDALARHTGTVIARDGLVIAKDTRTNQIHALREYDAALAWVVPTDPDATIVHSDNRHVYLLGEELIALDLRTGERVWWTPHPGDKADQPVFTQDACLIAGNQRLCRIDLTTGKLTHYREDFANPAALYLVGQQIVHVTPQRISAFRMP